MEKGHSPVQSIDRLFDIVEALSNAPRGMALSDLSAAVGLHTSTGCWLRSWRADMCKKTSNPANTG